LSTDLRLLIDEAVPDPLAHAIQKISAINYLYVRDVPEVAGKDDDTVMKYANKENRIVFTTEEQFKRFPLTEEEFREAASTGSVSVSTGRKIDEDLGNVIFYARDGKPFKARCSECGANARRRRVVEDSNSMIEVFCPNCDSRLLIVNDMDELRRHIAKGARLILPIRPRRSRS